MILFPAIDLKEGQCVRLAQGDMDRATVFNDDPAEQARAFQSQGFEYLHVVDLDGAFAGAPRNAAAVEAILKALTIPVQLGGGIRDMRTLSGWLDKGVTRVIIGTAAVRDPSFVREAARVYPGRVAVGIDAKDGMVAVEGWARTTRMSALDLGKSFEDAGVSAHHLHRHCARRHSHRAEHRADSGARQCADDSGHRIGRPRLARRYRTAVAARLRETRRRHHRPRAL